MDNSAALSAFGLLFLLFVSMGYLFPNSKGSKSWALSVAITLFGHTTLAYFALFVPTTNFQILESLVQVLADILLMIGACRFSLQKLNKASLALFSTLFIISLYHDLYWMHLNPLNFFVATLFSIYCLAAVVINLIKGQQSNGSFGQIFTIICTIFLLVLRIASPITSQFAGDIIIDFALVNSGVILALYFALALLQIGQGKVTKQIDYLRQSAETDPLTGLMNKSSMTRIFPLITTLGKRPHQQIALIYIDIRAIENSSTANSSAVKNRIISQSKFQMLAENLTESVRSCDICASISPHEFIVLVTHIDQPKHLADVAEKLLNNFNTLLRKEIKNRFSAFAGISLFPQHGETLDDLLYTADRAIYQVTKASYDSSNPKPLFQISDL